MLEMKKKERKIDMKNRIKDFVQSKYESEPKECSICYEDMVKGDIVTSLFCFHLFHFQCIEACLQTNTRCPVCNFDIVKHLIDEIQEGKCEIKEEGLVSKEVEEVKL